MCKAEWSIYPAPRNKLEVKASSQLVFDIVYFKLWSLPLQEQESQIKGGQFLLSLSLGLKLSSF